MQAFAAGLGPAHPCKGVEALWDNHCQGGTNQQAAAKCCHGIQVHLTHCSQETEA